MPLAFRSRQDGGGTVPPASRWLLNAAKMAAVRPPRWRRYGRQDGGVTCGTSARPRRRGSAGYP
jgi:hypothetical protein